MAGSAHIANNRHTDNWWLEELGGAVTTDSNGNSTLSTQDAPSNLVVGDQQTKITSSTTETTIVTADAAMKNNVYMLIISNTSASDTKVTIRSTTGGTPRFVFNVKAGLVAGFSLAYTSAIKQAAINTNWTAQCGTAVADIEITAAYVKGA